MASIETQTNQSITEWFLNHPSKNKPYVLFYGQDYEYGCFSNFYRCEIDYTIQVGKFINREVTINYSEQAIMLEKASLFDDIESFEKIIKAKNPNQAKKIWTSSKKF